ncbi:hypothetical protein LUZ62_083147 [Rhynchospora pubera]|uniref:DUF4220 domain-containing protein n=1 Tax=Rhynchospora pubera TaxID=906938 RepID=A0AAV8C2F8_9POAL|nr:hypothetical protein LUZ62_083147 [Rhynchospora pubera]
MNENQKYSCTSELAAEVLMVMTSTFIAITIAGVAAQKFLLLFNHRTHIEFTYKKSGVVISSAYTLFLPLMSYLFSQAKENNLEGRAQLILSWMVLIEVLRVYDGDSTWEARNSAEQLARLVWVSYLVYGYVPPNKLRAILLVLCAVCITYEIMKAIASKKAKKSYLLGRNPKLIHDFMNRIMLQDHYKTTPMSSCEYIVMGEENHEITICENGWHLGYHPDDEKPKSKGVITIGRVFQNSSEDSEFTMAHPNWRNSCLSFALAKMLRRRFANLPVVEEGNNKALNFVLEGLIGDLETQGSRGEKQPSEKVFCIIHDELKFVQEFSQTKVQIYKYFGGFVLLADMIGYMIVVSVGTYLLLSIAVSMLIQKRYTFLVYVPQDTANNNCFNDFSIFASGTLVAKIFYLLDQAITFLLVSACGYVQYYNGWAAFFFYRKSNLDFVRRYIENPSEWKKTHSSTQSLLDKLLNRFEVFVLSIVKNVEQARIHYSLFDTKPETTFCIKGYRKGEVLVVIHSTDVKEAILRSLKNSGGQLTSGETSLRSHEFVENMMNLCWPHISITEAILVWHIATTLFHHQKSPHQQQLAKPTKNATQILKELIKYCLNPKRAKTHIQTEPQSPQHNDDSGKKKREVALALSSYCLSLVACHPELLPEEVRWSKKMYKSVREEIFLIDKSSGLKPIRKDRCDYAMSNLISLEKFVLVGKGVKLAEALVKHDEEGKQVWTMLSEFWAEMMLFIAPSDNVKGHEKILEKQELITQIWALLTHSGILNRPKPTHPSCEPEKKNEAGEDMNV